jgi:hypothetical protein
LGENMKKGERAKEKGRKRKNKEEIAIKVKE